MFFKPLALLFDPGSSKLGLRERELAVFVEELWSPVHAIRRKKALVNQDSIERVLFRAVRRMGPYLPRAGPRFDLDLFQAEHHPFQY